jgi:hypothetical protein
VLIVQVIAALAGGAAYPINPQIEAYIGAVDVSMRSYFDGQITAPEALKAASDAIVNILAGATVTPTP